MEPQDFKKNLNIGIPHKEIPKGPRGEIRLVLALLVSFVLLMIIFGVVFYFYKYRQSINVSKSDSVYSTSTPKVLEWAPESVSFIPQMIYEKLPIEKDAKVSHSFIFVKDSEVRAKDEYESSKNIDEIFNAYKNYAEKNQKIFSQSTTTGKYAISFGRSAYTINVEIITNLETNKNQITVIFNQKIISSYPVQK